MPPRLAAFASRIGLTGLAIAVLVALLAIQTVRLEGFKLWPFSIEGARPKAERLQGVIDDIDKAQDDALKAAQEAKERAERNYRDLAERIDDDAEEARAGEMDAAERFIAASRVRCPSNRGASSGAVAPARDNGARDSETTGPAPELDAVAVPADDVRICTVNTLQAEAARAWALELEAAR
jgi:hypothetical protein